MAQSTIAGTILELNRQGLIPGPNESEEEFLKRAEYCFGLKENLEGEMRINIPFANESGGEGVPSVLGEALSLTKSLYDIEPAWVPLFFSNYQLLPWQGGSAWIFQHTEDSPTAAFLQLRRAFKNRKKYLGIYDREELLAHELAHVGRMLFEESKYEEMLAYQTSRSILRKVLGPIAQSSWESLLFVMALIAIIFGDLISVAYVELPLFWLKIVPFVLIAMATARLFMRRRTFHRCLQNVAQVVRKEHFAGPFVYRLTDCEIGEFAHRGPAFIKEYMAEHRHTSLRWRVIALAYS